MDLCEMEGQRRLLFGSGVAFADKYVSAGHGICTAIAHGLRFWYRFILDGLGGTAYIGIGTMDYWECLY